MRANGFLPGFMARYNARFAKPPARDQDFHRVLDPQQDLDRILCWREQRQVSHQLVVNYKPNETDALARRHRRSPPRQNGRDQ